MDKPLYTATAVSFGGRAGGNVSIPNHKVLSFNTAMPSGLGGPAANELSAVNPEQLFAMGYAACFSSAMGAAARATKLTDFPLDKTEVTCAVDIGKEKGGQGFVLAVNLQIKTPQGFEIAQMKKIVDAAHKVCPYSNATRNNIPVNIKVI